jgi:hypothetical protein
MMRHKVGHLLFSTTAALVIWQAKSLGCGYRLKHGQRLVAETSA